MDDQTRNETSAELDKFMLDYIKNGEIVLDGNGQPVKDERGQFIRKRSASMINAIRQRLKDAGVGNPATETNPIGQLAREMSKNPKPGISFKGRPVGAIPPIDTQNDDAATA